ncbi:MAG: hypothetical protein FJ253_01070 [Phycisphaerae bacterium]|nr:hypothetical protein [Phycisphaerae bacterium]
MHRSLVSRALLVASIPGALFASIAASAPQAEPPRGCVGHAALHGDRLVFESAGDLWTARVPPAVGASADRAGAGSSASAGSGAPIESWRLTRGAGSERWPTISPDGTLVAFAGEYDGNPEVYVMPVSGGTPRRLTFHPGRDVPLGWTPDGREVIFRSTRDTPFDRWQLWRVPVDGGAATAEPFGDCSLASIDPATGRIAFTRWSNENWNWRGYRGGTAPDLWIASPDRTSFTNITKSDANELFPVWVGGRVVFLSDEHGRSGIVSTNADGGDRRVLLPGAGPDGFDVRRLSADAALNATRVVFSRGCDAGILDAAVGSVRMLDLRLVGDRLDERERLVDPLEAITRLTVSPDGSSMGIETRGEILIGPIGDPKAGRSQRWRQLPGDSAVRDSGVAWISPEKILFVSSKDGVPSLVELPLGAKEGETIGESRRIELEPREWIFSPQVSPDGSRAAYSDKSLHLHLVELAGDMGGRRDRIVASATAGEITDYRFSPDGKFLAWEEPRRIGLPQIKVLSIADGSITTIGDGMSADTSPRWDPAGMYLYFLSRRNIDPLLDTFDFNFISYGPTVVCVLPLDSSTPPPIRAIAAAAGMDLEKWAKQGTPSSPDEKDADGDASGASEGDGKGGRGAKDERDGAAANAAKPAADEPTLPTVSFDPVDTAARIRRLPIDHGELDDLEAIPGGVLYLRRKPRTLNEEIWPPPPLGVPGAVLHRMNLVEDKDEPLLEHEVSAYAVSRDGSMVVAAQGKMLVSKEVDGGEKNGEPIDLEGVKVAVDVSAEWRQIFDDAWRLQRDFFWRSDYGGVDWEGVRAKYAALLPRIGTRAELNELIGQMMGELGTSHLYIGGGDDFAKSKPVSVGVLGVDLERRGEALAISRVLPDCSAGAEHASPLAAPHLGVKPGTVLRAVNGRPVDPARDPGELLVGLGGRTVELTLADDARGTNERRIEIEALEDDTALRYQAWVAENRRRVAERSGGRLGYLHLPDMDSEGLTEFVRQFYPQLDREGLVIDVRDNGGGFVSQMIIERLARRIWAWMMPRHGAPETYPQRVMDGPMAVIVDQHAGSDGDIFPESFKLRGIGPLVGTRTWGGVIGIRMDKPFIDGGVASQPEFAWWEPVRGFSLENTGVTPDVVVELTPEDRAADRDPQLDRTIDLLLERLKDRAPTPKPPIPSTASTSP